MKAVHLCNSCKAGGVKVPADVYVTGKVPGERKYWKPYRGYLCLEHLDMLLTDGAELKIVQRFGKCKEKWLDQLTYQYTGFHNFKALCQGFKGVNCTPTLRAPKHCSPEFSKAITHLRSEYYKATGKQAAK